MQDGDDGERDGQAHRVEHRRRRAEDADQQRLEEVRERRLADPAQRQARQRDAELGGRQVGVEVRDHVLRDLGAAVALAPDLDLRRPHLDQRELGGDEEAVQEHEQERQRNGERGVDLEADRGGPEASRGTLIRTRWCRARP